MPTEIIESNTVIQIVEDVNDVEIIEITQKVIATETIITGPAGPQGPQGLQGPQGIPGSGDKSYTHNQNAPALTWVINHNLGKYPSVDVVDSAGTTVIGDVQYTSINSVELNFSAEFSGIAYLN